MRTNRALPPMLSHSGFAWVPFLDGNILASTFNFLSLALNPLTLKGLGESLPDAKKGILKKKKRERETESTQNPKTYCLETLLVDKMEHNGACVIL